MAGSYSEESAGSSMDEQELYDSEALAEWRSSEQVENGLTSTSPPYWDSDDENDYGPKPSELYGRNTWKIEKFSQINKRELRSNAFEVGGYKWYILIYPQGCDVSNHLSLFLCVANHDKLLPGWSHFAQFTIAVVNKDPKKSKYSDTLHRFWKKEHDWGWKKFIELSKVLDGFVDDDTLIIKTQVQVIRERADRPFRCLDRQYRRELVRVYLTNVEQICRRFLEEKRGRLVRLMEDKARWSSFCAFWLGMDPNTRRSMSVEKTDSVLKAIVKHFFIEKEVTSTLVIDSLHSGLKALKGETSKKAEGGYFDDEEPLVPIVHVEKDTFVLADDVLVLLTRVAVPLPPEDEKGPQIRMKDVEDFSYDSSERDEMHLTELGRRTIEILALAHIFSKIDVAYQEAISLKRQEELIREEEAADNEQKLRRGKAEKEKKPKKKQAKNKKNCRKDKGRSEKPDTSMGDKPKSKKDSLVEDAVNPDTDTSEIHPVSDVSSDVGQASHLLQPRPKQVAAKKEVVVPERKSTVKKEVGVEKPIKVKTTAIQSSTRRQMKNLSSATDSKLQSKTGSAIDTVREQKTGQEISAKSAKPTVAENPISQPGPLSSDKSNFEQSSGTKAKSQKVPPKTEKPPATQPAILRPLSAPLIPGTEVCTPVVPLVQTAQSLSRSVSAAGRLNRDPSPATASHVPQSYRNAMMGNQSTASSTGCTLTHSSTSEVNSMHSYSQPSAVISAPMYLPQSSKRMDTESIRSDLQFGMVSHDVLQNMPQWMERQRMDSSRSDCNPPVQNVPQWMENPPRDTRRSINGDRSLHHDIQNFNMARSVQCRSQDQFPFGSPAVTSGRQVPGASSDDFPHLDIINNLLEDESGIFMGATRSSGFQSYSNVPHYLNHQEFASPGDIGLPSGLGSSTSMFEQTQSYHGNEYYHRYNFASDQFDSSWIQQANPQPYQNEINGLIPNQWQAGGSNLSYPTYRIPEYSNLVCGSNGYTAFRPSSRH